jgi:LCP family protein required for cell wall assembly
VPFPESGPCRSRSPGRHNSGGGRQYHVRTVRSPLSALRALSGRIVIAVVVCAAVTGVAVFQVNRYIDDEVAKIPHVSVQTAPATGSWTNFLIVGSDTRSFVQSQADRQAFTNQDTTTDGPARSDTMMVLHADGKNSYAVSFPRDLYVDVPGLGKQKINAAFNKGPQLVIDTLKADFNIDIQHYLEVNFKTFEDIVNAVGSVPVYFPYPARDEFSGLTNVWAAGCYHLDGGPALAYVRSRDLEYYVDGEWQNGSPRADIDRIQRQQDFIKKLGRIAVQRTLDDPLIARDLADQVIPNLAADPGFDRAAFNQLVQAFIGLSGDSGGPSFQTLPWKMGNSSGSFLLVQEPEADAMLAILRGQAPIPTPTTAPSGTDGGATTTPAGVRPVDVRVKVLNASGVKNAAGDTSQKLSQLGFVPGSADNDPRGVVDHSEVRYAPADLAKAKLVASHVADAQLIEDSSLPGTDVVLVVGKSFQGLGTTATTGAPAAPTTTLSPEAACQ